MKVTAGHSLILQELLRTAMAEGNNWMVYRSVDNELQPAHVLCFEKEKQALAFREDMKSRFDFDVMPLSPVFQTLSHHLYVHAWTDNANRLLPCDVNLELPLIVNQNKDEIWFQRQVEKLLDELAPLGFTDSLNLEFDIRFELQFNKAFFRVKDWLFFGEDKMGYNLFFEKSGKNFTLSGYDAILRRPIAIPHAVAGEITAENLDTRMAAIDWTRELVRPLFGGMVMPEKIRLRQGVVDNILQDVETLSKAGPDGALAAGLLRYKHWDGTENEGEAPGLQALQAKYTTMLHVQTPDSNSLRAEDAYQFLAGRFPVLDGCNGYNHYLFTDKNLSIMANERTNLEYLVDNLKYLGFGEKPELKQQLEQNVTAGKKEFTLVTSASFKDTDKTVDATLHFRRSEQTGMVFFNKYDALISNGKEASKSSGQTFYINKGNGVTLKEAFNLLEGRSVNKDLVSQEGKKYNAWLKLNFEEIDGHKNYKVQQFSGGYGYDLKELLSQLPLQLKYNDSFANITKQLEKGNRVPVVFESNGKTQQGFLEANPKFKQVNVSEDMRRFLKEVKSLDLGTTEGKTQGQDKAKGDEQKNNRKNKPVTGEKPEPEGEKTFSRKK